MYELDCDHLATFIIEPIHHSMRQIPVDGFRWPDQRPQSLDRVCHTERPRKDHAGGAQWVDRRSKSLEGVRTTRSPKQEPNSGEDDSRGSTACDGNGGSEVERALLILTSGAGEAVENEAAAVFQHFPGSRGLPRTSSWPRFKTPLASRRRVPDSGNQSRHYSYSTSKSRERDDRPYTKHPRRASRTRSSPMVRIPVEILEGLNRHGSRPRPPDQYAREKRNNEPCRRGGRESHHRSESQEPRRRRSRDLSESPVSGLYEASDVDDDEMGISGSYYNHGPAWTAALEDIKMQHRKKFKEIFGSLRLSDSQWTAAFRVYKGILFSAIYEAMNTLDPEVLQGALGGDTEFRGTPNDVFLNTTRNFIKEINRRNNRTKISETSLEAWLLGRLWEAFRDEFVHAKVGSEEEFVQKWENLAKQYPEMERELAEALNTMDQLPRKWLEPNINARNARIVMEYLFKDPLQLKARVLLANAVDPRKFFITMSQAHPELLSILERIHTIDKNIDRVLYGMPIGKKSQAFLASQELGTLEYFKCDEVNLSWRSIFAAVDFSLSDRSIGVQVSKSALKAKHYYDLILDAASFREQSWLHEELHKCAVDQETIDFQIVGRKWETLQAFVRSAQPKARKIWALTQAPTATGMFLAVSVAPHDSLTVSEAQPHLRRRHVRQPSGGSKSQVRGVPEEAPNAIGPPDSNRRRKNGPIY
jgi:hypothetical protein